MVIIVLFSGKARFRASNSGLPTRTFGQKVTKSDQNDEKVTFGHLFSEVMSGAA